MQMGPESQIDRSQRLPPFRAPAQSVNVDLSLALLDSFEGT